MPLLTLNPGFVLLLAVFVVLAAPRAVRPVIMGVSALAALWLLLEHEFGAATAIAQMGLPVVPLDIDELNRIFGIALLISLLIIAIHAGSRRHRAEDAAILLMAGGAVTALFVGDIVSFVASSSIVGFGVAWTVFASPVPGADRAGVRLLIWQGVEGLLFLIGVALRLSAGAQSAVLSRLDAEGVAEAFILAALLVRVGAPLAHVWLKDAVAHASASGAAGITAFSSMLAVYGLARFFSAEAILLPVGATLIVIALFFTAVESDLRRAAAYGFLSCCGVCVALIGIGSPLALAGGEAMAFASVFAFLAYQLGIGGVFLRLGHARVSGFAGLFSTFPLSAPLLVLSGCAVAALPGFAMFTAHALALEAVADWDLRWLWALIALQPGVLFAVLALAPLRGAARASEDRARLRTEAPYAALLATTLAVFFSLAVGLAPGWLFSLLPGELQFQANAPDRLGAQLQVLGVSGAVFLGLWSIRQTLSARGEALDVDALYRGPLSHGAGWVGARASDAAAVLARLAEKQAIRVAGLVAETAQRRDNPYRTLGSATVWGAALALILAALAADRLFG